MSSEVFSWLRETGRLTLRYLAVGICFVPAGLMYAVFREVGWDGLGSIALSLGSGFSIAYFVWNWLEARERVALPPISRELALLLSDSMEGNWTDGVITRREKAEELGRVLLEVKIALQGRDAKELRSLLELEPYLRLAAVRQASETDASGGPGLAVHPLGAQHAALSSGSS